MGSLRDALPPVRNSTCSLPETDDLLNNCILLPPTSFVCLQNKSKCYYWIKVLDNVDHGPRAASILWLWYLIVLRYKSNEFHHIATAIRQLFRYGWALLIMWIVIWPSDAWLSLATFQKAFDFIDFILPFSHISNHNSHHIRSFIGYLMQKKTKKQQL